MAKLVTPNEIPDQRSRRPVLDRYQYRRVVTSAAVVNREVVGASRSIAVQACRSIDRRLSPTIVL
jgi:hypothetical protein